MLVGENSGVVLDMQHVADDENEQGSGDSVADADELEDLDSALKESLHNRLLQLIQNEDDDTAIDDSEQNGILLQKGVDKEVALPSPPSNWAPPTRKIEKLEPPFVLVDNPGDWSEFTFRPKFERKKGANGMYIAHVLPTGAQPVAKNNESGERVCAGWKFHYKEWKRSTETTANKSTNQPTEEQEPTTRTRLF